MAEDNDAIGKSIGNYRITAELGSGGFADVYLGQHIIFADKPPVAIKLLYARLKLKEREQFIQEAQLLHQLHHPHILPILDAGFQNGTPYIIMEYAAKGSLQDRLDQHPGKPLPLAEALTIVTDIGEALYYAHQQNIVHRDLKPDNILFNARGEALLADFGLAAILSSARSMHIGSAGTPAYMAPEMFEGTVSVKSDQYTLGCIAYELLTGRKPFDVEGVPWYAAQYQHAKVPPTAPTQYNSSIPSHAEQAILTAMAKDRNTRHADVRTFLTALQAPQAPQKSAQEWFKEGNALDDLKRHDEAIAAYEQALRLDPNFAWAYHNKGFALSGLKCYDEAIATYDQALRLDPNYAWAYHNKGFALSGLKCYDEAIATYDQALRLDPNYAWAYHNKGFALSGLKCYDEAIAAYDQAIRLDPNYAFAYYNKGSALDNLKRYDEAIAAYDQALRLDPNYADYYNGKGNALNQLGRKREAQQAYEKAKQLRGDV